MALIVEDGTGLSTAATLVMYNGSLIAGGAFTNADGTGINYLAQWNGSAWLELPSSGNSVTLS